jgi:nicotinamide phosphoribosyltransferase
MSDSLFVIISALTDSYKYGHFCQYPKDTDKMVAYGEFRKPFNNDTRDQRIVFYGIRYIIENYVSRKWTLEDVDKIEHFLSTHNVANTPYPFPKDLFIKFIKENDGRFPVIIESLPEGTVVYPHVPVYQITALKEYAPLVTFLETIMTHVWYPSTVATLSRKCKQVITDKFDEAGVADSDRWILDYKLHDFGFRGTTCVEQSIIGGVAHLLNFRGTDTVSAAYYAQYTLNEGKPVGSSIPATEHSVMLSFGKRKDHLDNGGYANEIDAIQNMVNINDGLFACVMDTYDFHNTIFKILPTIKNKSDKRTPMVLRPDSGEPKEVVLDAMIAIEIMLSNRDADFYNLDGHRIGHGNGKNKNKYLKFDGFSVIQGDGVDLKAIEEVLTYIMCPKNRKKRIETLYDGKFKFEGKKVCYKKGFLISDKDKKQLLKHDVAYSPYNCTFGMGGGLLQKVNRDTMSFATKLCYLERKVNDNTVSVNVMKDPKTDVGKRSMPGELAVKSVLGLPTVFPKSCVDARDNLLKVVYNGYDNVSPVHFEKDNFDQIRARVEEQWSKLPNIHNAISEEIQKLQHATSVE